VATYHREKNFIWASWPDKKLLGLQLSDLDLSLKGSMVEECLKQLYAELRSRHLKFRPHVWLSDDWYTPDGVPGIAIPFYLAHPRLERLEYNQMFEVEGGTREGCMKILRHEAGHAIENAFGLRRRKKRQKIFGKTSQKYPNSYSPKPYSRSYVLHLDSWYAQSHPDEDFAETFAVWLTPHSNWRQRYCGWPAFKKLSYIDSLMEELASQKAKVSNRIRIDPIRKLTVTLKEHYREKRMRLGLSHPNFYDRDLQRIFSADTTDERNMTAARFLRKIRMKVRREVAHWTGEYQYTIDSVISDIIDRAEELELRVVKGAERTEMELTILLTVQTMNYLHSGRHRVSL